MNTITKDNIDTNWINLVTELSLENSVSYIIQNVCPYPLEFLQKDEVPSESDFGQVIIPNSPWIITVDTSTGIYIRNQKNDDKKLGRIAFAVLATTLIVLTSYIQLNSIAAKYERVNRAYDREALIISELHNVAENHDIYCDIVTEKVTKAYGHHCSLISTWNLTRNLGEADGFYSKFELSSVSAYT